MGSIMVEASLLEEWNPWWSSGEVPPQLAGIPRDPTAKIAGLLDAPEVISIVGVRRAGKTTIMYQLVQRLLAGGVPPENVLWAYLEDPALGGAELGEILSAYVRAKAPRGRTYAFLDEVQASEGWQRWVLREYERKRPVKFIVSGSSSALVRSELARLLVGRDVTVPITPLSLPEFLRFNNETFQGLAGSDRQDRALHWLERYLATGGFPEAVLGTEEGRWGTLRHILDTLLYREVVHPHRVKAPDLEAVMGFVLSNVGKPLTLNNISDAAGPAVNTVKSYIQHLSEAMLIAPVPPLTYTTKPSRRQNLPYKYYCIDTGLRNAASTSRTGDLGRLVENVVCIELLRRGVAPEYWAGRHEVDFVLGPWPGTVTPMNVCYADDVPEREYEGLKEFKGPREGSVAQPLILTKAKEGEDRGVRHVPVWKWLLEGRADGRARLPYPPSW